MDEKLYTMAEAAELLGVSNKTLVNWVNVGGLRRAVEAQTFEYDKRTHYLTRAQLEKIAKDHRRGYLPLGQYPGRRENIGTGTHVKREDLPPEIQAQLPPEPKEDHAVAVMQAQVWGITRKMREQLRVLERQLAQDDTAFDQLLDLEQLVGELERAVAGPPPGYTQPMR